MPLMTTRGALSARGFGLFGNPRKWVTVTFTANTTWTCPAGVSSVNLSGHGSAALSDYGATTGYTIAEASQTPPPSFGLSPPYGQWSDLYGYFTTVQSKFASVPGYVPSFTVYTCYVIYDDGYYYIADTFSVYSSLWVTSVTYTSYNSPPTSGNITYSSLTPIVSAGWGMEVNYLLPGHAGAASTGFSNSFPGGVYSGTYPYGVAVPPVITNFTNVAVTPTTGYPLVIPAGGSISISYLV